MTISIEGLSLIGTVVIAVFGFFIKLSATVIKELRQIKQELIILNTNKEVQAVRMEDINRKVNDHEGRIRVIEGRRHVET